MGHFLRNLIGQIIDFMDYIIIENIIQAPGHSVSCQKLASMQLPILARNTECPIYSLNCVSNT